MVWPIFLLLLAIAFFMVPYGGWYVGPGAWVAYWIAVLFVIAFVLLLVLPSRGTSIEERP